MSQIHLLDHVKEKNMIHVRNPVTSYEDSRGETSIKKVTTLDTLLIEYQKRSKGF